VTPVSGTFPVLLSTNTWAGPVVVTPRFAVVVHVAGVRVALTTAAMPVPVRVTGEPVTVTFAVMVNVPFAAPGGAIGENTTLIVQVPAAGVSVPVQVPLPPPPAASSVATRRQV